MRIDAYTVVVVVGFFASRVYLAALGIRFDAGGLAWYWQFLDPAWLRTDLARSLVYLHAQPPLVNAVLGLGLKLAGVRVPEFFALVFLAGGLVLALSLFGVLKRLRVARPLAAAIALFYTWSPTAVLYERWLMYTHWESVALIVAALLLHRLVAAGRLRDCVLYFLALIGLALTRSLFHVIWLIPCATIALLAVRVQRGRILVLGGLSMAIVLGLYAKNELIFGVPGASSWLGMSLAHGVFDVWSEAERSALAEAGIVSTLATIEPFSTLESYPASFQIESPIAVAALRAHGKQSLVTNYNHAAFVEIARQYQRDWLVLMRRDPARYLTILGRAWTRFFEAPSNYGYMDRNRRVIRGWDRLYNVIFGIPRAYRGPLLRHDQFVRPGWERVAWIWLFLSLAAAVFAARLLVRALRGSRRGDAALDGSARAELAVIAFALVNVSYVAIVANALELGENNRFRVAIEPLLFVLVAVMIRRLVIALAPAKLRGPP